MKTIIRTGFVLCIALLFPAGSSFSSTVPDTGQSKCYNNSGEIPCPTAGQPFYGQDASYTINPSSYVKLDINGDVLPDSASTWAMTMNNATGLIWENKTDDDSIHDKDNTYTWFNSDPSSNGGNSGFSGNGTDTEDFIRALNDAVFGGYADWRLPTIKELAYLVNNSIPHPGPTIDTSYFPYSLSSFYWSSTTLANDVFSAWGMSFDYGYDSSKAKNVRASVRAVRGGP